LVETDIRLMDAGLYGAGIMGYWTVVLCCKVN